MNNEIKEIVQNSIHLSNYDKDVLCSVFKNLQDVQKDMFEKINDNVMHQMFHNKEVDENWNVVTALIDTSEIKNIEKNGFFEICKISPFHTDISLAELLNEKDEFSDLNTVNCGIAFLGCSYHEMIELTNKEYVAMVETPDETYEITYRLVPFTAYYSKEEKLARTARQYGLTRPVIFSPMSRRAVNVELDFNENDIPNSKNIKIDFLLKENHLKDYLFYNKTLVWNVEWLEQHKIPRPKENIDKKIVPLFENTYHIYEFLTQKNEYIFFESQVADIKRYGNTIYVGLSDRQNIESSRYSKLVIHSYDSTGIFFQKFLYFFENFYYNNRFLKERIRTEADIAYVLGYFKNDIANYLKMVRMLGNNKAIRTYESRDAYYYGKEKALRSSSICYIKFSENEHWLFEDYVSYILEYMNYYYPEFYWVGVV